MSKPLDTSILKSSLDINLSKYEKEIKNNYPFLEDKDIKDFTESLYNFLLGFYITQIH